MALTGHHVEVKKTSSGSYVGKCQAWDCWYWTPVRRDAELVRRWAAAHEENENRRIGRRQVAR
jgi:hypothetical protein